MVYLDVCDFSPKEVKILTIVKAVETLMSNGTDNRVVLHFEQDELPMIVKNRRNSKRIHELSGSKFINDWVGTRIKVAVNEINLFGKIHEVVRVQ